MISIIKYDFILGIFFSSILALIYYFELSFWFFIFLGFMIFPIHDLLNELFKDYIYVEEFK